MARNLSPIMAQFQDQPALIEEGRGAWLEACLHKVDEAAGEFAKIEASNDNEFWFDPDDYRSYYRPYKVKDGILHVPVKGVLLNNFPYSFGSWATGYEYNFEAVKRGMEDSNVRGIAFFINSGGGLVSGNFDLNDKLYAFRGRKPMRSYASEHAYSAAYSIATVGDSITVARTGGVGSIGVVVVHMEISKALEERGITTTIIRSKPGKMEGNGYETLSEGARERIQERVDEFHTQFAAIVARNRGLTVEAVDATNALTFMPQQAIDNGLADEIGNFDDALTAFVATINSEGDEEMADPTYSKAQLDEAVAAAVATATATAKAEGVSEGTAAGATAERARVTAIVTSDEGKKRPAAAIKLATNEKLASLDAAAISDLLADMPEEKPKAEGKSTGGAPKGMLKAAMENGGAGVETVEDDEGDGDEETAKASASKVAGALAMVKGDKPKIES